MWSKKLNIDRKNYNLEGVIPINSSYYGAIDDMINRKNTIGFIYGEFGTPERFDVSLAGVSHNITDIVLDKVSNYLNFKCEVLNTQKGNELKTIIDAGIPGLRMCIRGIKSKGVVTRIFTLDVDFLPNPTPEELLREERREKLDKINERT